MADKKTPAKKKPAAAKPAVTKPSPTPEAVAAAAYQHLYQLRKAVEAAREEVAAANRNMERASGLNTISHRVAAEDQARAQLADAKASFVIARDAFTKARANA